MAEDWYGVRTVYRHEALEVYEERVTIWRADSVGAAIALAEDEAAEYSSILDITCLDLVQAYRLADDVGSGAEVFSLMRESDLDAERYLDAFFDTGTERNRAV